MEDQSQRFGALIVQTTLLAGICAQEMARTGILSAEAAGAAVEGMKCIAQLLEVPDDTPQGASVMMHSLALQVQRHMHEGRTKPLD